VNLLGKRRPEKGYEELMDANGCHVDPIIKQPTSTELDRTRSTYLAIRGMGCPTCARRVSNALLRLTGVTQAIVDHTEGMAQVSYNPAIVTSEQLIWAVATAGGDANHQYIAQVMD
jgi:copper chaperone CopZ